MSGRFDRERIEERPLAERMNKLDVVRGSVDPASCGIGLSARAAEDVGRAAEEIRAARGRGAPAILAFGAHAVKNGLSKVLIGLAESGWISHFATNGAGIIHDWEFAFQGKSGEDVRRYAAEGQFGIWEETGLYLNLALAIGAWRGLGYGEAVGSMILDEGLPIPPESELAEALAAGGRALAGAAGDGDPGEEGPLGRAAAAADLAGLLAALRRPRARGPGRPAADPGAFPASGGFLPIPHPHKAYSLAAAARRLGVPFTCHPMFGHDIIYTHPASRGAPIGRTAELDFLSFVDSVSRLEGGVYLSVGSAVMSPMVFEKALSMSRNVVRQEGRSIEDFSIHVVDLAASAWDWKRDGEPPQDDPAYYLRFCKTFSRMGGRMSYASADNRAWLSALARELGPA